MTLSASASDPHGVASVAFYAGGTPLGTDTTPPYSVAWANVPSGTHSLSAIATDVYGATATSSAVSIAARNVVSVSVSPAQVTTGNNALVTVQGSSVCGAVTIDYGDGAVIMYAINGLPVSYYHAWATGGSKTITATGQANCIGTASTSVSVNARPAVSLTSPGNGARIRPRDDSALRISERRRRVRLSVAYYVNGIPLATVTSTP